jgi:hypothetical protein
MNDPQGSVPPNPQAELAAVLAAQRAGYEQRQEEALARLEAVNRELAASTGTVARQLSQVRAVMGDPLSLYRSQLNAMHGYYKRFAEFIPAAADLSSHGFSALRDRLSFLLSDTEQAIAIVNKMCVDGAATNAAVFNTYREGGIAITTSMQAINEGWRKAFGVAREQ